MTTTASLEKLGKTALKLPAAVTGLSCAGTVLETPTVTVGGKAFLFLGREYARFKLGASMPAAHELAAKYPDHLKVDPGGWTKLSVVPGDPIPVAVINGWIVESYRLMAPKRLLATLDGDI